MADPGTLEISEPESTANLAVDPRLTSGCGCALHGAGAIKAIIRVAPRMPAGCFRQPLMALIVGILILIMPRLLNYIVAIYLIVTGLVGLFGLRI